MADLLIHQVFDILVTKRPNKIIRAITAIRALGSDAKKSNRYCVYWLYKVMEILYSI
jgi:hypothetical protein